MDMNMEELHMAAVAYYHNSAPHLQQLVANFFCSMDTNQDGGVSFDEFLNFIQQCGYNNWIDPNYFFRSLNRNRVGRLDFSEVLTLYYIMKTRSVQCRYCGTWLVGLYFTCVQCFDTANSTTYDLCAPCYGNPQRFHHHHHAGTNNTFLDNYVLLRSKRGLFPGEANSNMALVPILPQGAQPNAANAPGRSRWRMTLRALEMALSVGNILVSCSIM